MFNPEGGSEIKESSGIDYKAVFTGVVDALPLRFNPTKSEIIEIKGIPDDKSDKIQEPSYVNVVTRNDGKKESKLQLLMSIHPNELLCKTIDDDGNVFIEKKYNDDHYFTVDIFMSKEFEVSQAGNFRFINESLQSTWAKSLDDIKANKKMDWFDVSSARQAKKGEVQLYNLLYAWYNKSGSKDSPIKGFKLGEDPSETFDEIVDGDVSILNEMLEEGGSSRKYFSHDDGSLRKIAVLLGVKASEKTDNEGNFYYNQVTFGSSNVSTYAKEGRSLYKDAKLAVEEGRFKAVSTFDFQVYDPLASIAGLQSQIDTDIVDNDPHVSAFDMIEDSDFD